MLAVNWLIEYIDYLIHVLVVLAHLFLVYEMSVMYKLYAVLMFPQLD